jgi:hypothetical protein
MKRNAVNMRSWERRKVMASIITWLMWRSSSDARRPVNVYTAPLNSTLWRTACQHIYNQIPQALNAIEYTVMVLHAYVYMLNMSGGDPQLLE